MDTAGFHKEADNDIELEGIERAKKCANDADIVIAVFDYNDKANDDDINLIEFLQQLKNKNIIYVLNKIDLEKKFDKKIDNAIEISTKTKQGKDKLIEALKNHIKDSDITIFNKESYVNNSLGRLLGQATERGEEKRWGWLAAGLTFLGSWNVAYWNKVLAGPILPLGNLAALVVLVVCLGLTGRKTKKSKKFEKRD